MMCSIHLCLQTGRKDILPRLEAKVPGQKEPQERLSSDSYLSRRSYLWDPSPRVPALPRGSDDTPLPSWSSAQPNPFHFLSFHFALFYSFIVLHGRHTNSLFKRLLGVAICVFFLFFPFVVSQNATENYLVHSSLYAHTYASVVYFRVSTTCCEEAGLTSQFTICCRWMLTYNSITVNY